MLTVGSIRALSPKSKAARDLRKAYRAKKNAHLKRALGIPICGAKAKSTGKPCQATKLLRGGRCKLHGGMSTGPKTPEGRARARACLKQYRTT
jgi:hypothetical protein